MCKFVHTSLRTTTLASPRGSANGGVDGAHEAEGPTLVKGIHIRKLFDAHSMGCPVCGVRDDVVDLRYCDLYHLLHFAQRRRAYKCFSIQRLVPMYLHGQEHIQCFIVLLVCSLFRFSIVPLQRLHGQLCGSTMFVQ